LNCAKVTSGGCRSCSGRLFHSIAKTAVTELVAWSLDQAHQLAKGQQCPTTGR